MENINNEQWLSDGECNECRRKNYCKTECRANKKRVVKTVIKKYYDSLLERVEKGEHLNPEMYSVKGASDEQN